MDEKNQKILVVILVILLIVVVFCVYSSISKNAEKENDKRTKTTSQSRHKQRSPPPDYDTVVQACDALHQISPGSECSNETCSKGYSFCLSRNAKSTGNANAKADDEDCTDACIDLYDRVTNDPTSTIDMCALDFCVEVIPELRDLCVDCSIYDLDQCRSELEIVDAIDDKANCTGNDTTGECFEACELLRTTPEYNVCASTYCFFHDSYNSEYCDPCSLTSYTNCTPQTLGPIIDGECDLENPTPECESSCLELTNNSSNIPNACMYSPEYCAWGMYKTTCNPCTLNNLPTCTDDDELAGVIADECGENSPWASGVAKCEIEGSSYSYLSTGEAPILKVSQSSFKDMYQEFYIDGSVIGNNTYITMAVDANLEVFASNTSPTSVPSCPSSGLEYRYDPPTQVFNNFEIDLYLLISLTSDNIVTPIFYWKNNGVQGEQKLPSLGSYQDFYVEDVLSEYPIFISTIAYSLVGDSYDYFSFGAIVTESAEKAVQVAAEMSGKTKVRFDGNVMPGSESQALVSSRSKKKPIYSYLTPSTKKKLQTAMNRVEKYMRDQEKKSR